VKRPDWYSGVITVGTKSPYDHAVTFSVGNWITFDRIRPPTWAARRSVLKQLVDAASRSFLDGRPAELLPELQYAAADLAAAERQNEAMADFPVVTGLDGKTYPRFQLSADDRDFLIATCHQLAHDHGLSVRAVKQFLGERGMPRSVGSIVAYLARPCEMCHDQHRALERDQLGLMGFMIN
jgi:hypothetical protein